MSWRDGGLERFAADFLESHQHLIGTAAMHRFGMKRGQIYSPEQVRQIRRELGYYAAQEFLLKGETRTSSNSAGYEDAESIEFRRREAQSHPTGYSVEHFKEVCEIEPESLARHLKRLLVDPESRPTSGLKKFPGLWAALCSVRDKEAEAACKNLVETAVSRQVFDELDYALHARNFVLLEGREGVGKSESARAWCAQRPGRALYVCLESGVDEMTLYRSIAQRLGTACSYGRKATEMRVRIQDALQPGQLMLVIDEAHHLWPSSGRCERAAPKRVDWLRTALIDFGVPVALLSTPQYFARACERFRKGGWNSLQIQRRLARTATLPEPDAVPLGDVLAVVRSYFPAVSAMHAKQVAALAIGTVGFLTTIKHTRQRFDFLASRRPELSEPDLLAEVLREAGLRAPEQTAPSQHQPVDWLVKKRQATEPAVMVDALRDAAAKPVLSHALRHRDNSPDPGHTRSRGLNNTNTAGSGQPFGTRSLPGVPTPP